MTWDELAELHAKATWTARQGGFMPWSDLSERGKEIEREASRAALSAIREAGVRLMPEEAKPLMGLAAFRAVGLTKQQAELAYTAMLAAGEIKPEGGE